MGHLIGGLLSWRFIAHLADQLPPIFLGSQTATDRRQLLVVERHLAAAPLARYLDEAWFGAGGDFAGKLEAIRHRPIGARSD